MFCVGLGSVFFVSFGVCCVLGYPFCLFACVLYICCLLGCVLGLFVCLFACVLFCYYLIRGPHTLGPRQHNHTCRTPAEHLQQSRASFSLMLAHLGALGRHVGPLGRHLVPLARHLIANMSENVLKSSKTAPKMPQTPLPSLPKVQKDKETHKFFKGFSLARPSLKIIKKCSQNCPRSSQVELEMPILALSCRTLALSWPLLAPSWPI